MTLIDREKQERKHYLDESFRERTKQCDYFCPLEEDDLEEAGVMSDNEGNNKEIEYGDESLQIGNDEKITTNYIE